SGGTVVRVATAPPQSTRRDGGATSPSGADGAAGVVANGRSPAPTGHGCAGSRGAAGARCPAAGSAGGRVVDSASGSKSKTLSLMNSQSYPNPRSGCTRARDKVRNPDHMRLVVHLHALVPIVQLL